MAYQKQNFMDGNVLYASQLNHIEDGIVENEKDIKNIKTYVTPEMFGAVGDGVTDDTAAIKNAINYCKNNNTVLTSCGKVYHITDDVTIDCIVVDFNNGQLLGNNNVLTMSSDIETSQNRCVLRNIRLKKITIVTTGYNNDISNLNLEEWVGTAIRYKGGNFHDVYLNNYAVATGEIGLFIDQPDVWVHNIVMVGAVTAFVLNGWNIHVSDSEVWLNNRHDIANSICYDIRQSGSIIENCTSDTYATMVKLAFDYLAVHLIGCMWIYNKNMAPSVKDLYLFKDSFKNCFIKGDLLCKLTGLAAQGRSLTIGANSQLALTVVDGRFFEPMSATLSGNAYGTVKRNPDGYVLNIGYNYKGGLPVGEIATIDLNGLYCVGWYNEKNVNAVYTATDGTSNICTIGIKAGALVISGHQKPLDFLIFNGVMPY